MTTGSNAAEGMRLAAYTQPDDSPLYGFIRFRRRSVLVKYVPEGTSRVNKGEEVFAFPESGGGCGGEMKGEEQMRGMGYVMDGLDGGGDCVLLLVTTESANKMRDCFGVV